MENWKLSAKDVERARSYVPMAEKIAFAERVSNRCRCVVRIGVQEDAQQVNSLPNMHTGNTERKMRYMMGALLRLYFGVDFESAEGDEMLLSADDYDRAAGAHLLNQIERMKTDKSVRDKCFDILQDYKVLEKMANAELYATLQIENDPVSRLSAYFQASISPENIQRLQKQAEGVKEDIEAYLKERDEHHAET